MSANAMPTVLVTCCVDGYERYELDYKRSAVPVIEKVLAVMPFDPAIDTTHVSPIPTFSNGCYKYILPTLSFDPAVNTIRASHSSATWYARSYLDFLPPALSLGQLGYNRIRNYPLRPCFPPQ